MFLRFRRSTLDMIPLYIEEIDATFEQRPMIALVGTHCDYRQEKQVTTREGEQVAKQYNIPLFFEVDIFDAQSVIQTIDKCVTSRHLLSKYGDKRSLLIPNLLWKKKNVLCDVDFIYK